MFILKKETMGYTYFTYVNPAVTEPKFTVFIHNVNILSKMKRIIEDKPFKI